MASPAFWDDNRRAQELIRERAELARLVARVTELGGQASDLAVLLELAGEAGARRGGAPVRRGVTKLQPEPEPVSLKEVGTAHGSTPPTGTSPTPPSPWNK